MRVMGNQEWEMRAKTNTVHFAILMAAAKSTRMVGWGARGRSL
jgi:hypothetical protein